MNACAYGWQNSHLNDRVVTIALDVGRLQDHGRNSGFMARSKFERNLAHLAGTMVSPSPMNMMCRPGFSITVSPAGFDTAVTFTHFHDTIVVVIS